MFFLVSKPVIELLQQRHDKLCARNPDKRMERLLFREILHQEFDITGDMIMDRSKNQCFISETIAYLDPSILILERSNVSQMQLKNVCQVVFIIKIIFQFSNRVIQKDSGIGFV